jgi:hypothetical protein
VDWSEIWIEALMHLRNDALDLALLLSSDCSGTLQKVGLMRHATDELTVIRRSVKAKINRVIDLVGKRTTCSINFRRVR